MSGGRLWVIGGADDSVRFEDAWYSTDGINWTKASSQTDLGRESAGGVVFGGKMWLIGGTTAHNYNYGNEVLWSY